MCFLYYYAIGTSASCTSPRTLSMSLSDRQGSRLIGGVLPQNADRHGVHQPPAQPQFLNRFLTVACCISLAASRGLVLSRKGNLLGALARLRHRGCYGMLKTPPMRSSLCIRPEKAALNLRFIVSGVFGAGGDVIKTVHAFPRGIQVGCSSFQAYSFC